MKRFLLHTDQKRIAWVILVALLFLFLHSEFDLFSPKNHSHGAHDFCRVMDGSIQQTHPSANPSSARYTIAHSLFGHDLSDQLIAGNKPPAWTDVGALNRKPAVVIPLYLTINVLLI